MNISSEQDLQDISSNDKEIFKIEEDITVSKEFETIEQFNGTLDGQGHTIYNLTSAFIETLGKESIIKNITFKQVDLEDEGGLFYENNGTIKSIRVENINLRIFDRETQFFSAAIVKENYEKIQDCTVRNADINTDLKFGVIAGLNEEGSIIDCSSTNVKAVTKICGGICGEIKSGVIKDCHTKNADLTGGNAISGIVGDSKSGDVQDCSVKNSEIESEFFDGGGIIGRAEDTKESHVQNCVVEDTDITGLQTAYLIADPNCHSTSCSVINCSATQIEDFYSNSGLSLFTDVSEGCFITDTVVKGTVRISKNPEKITNSYANVEIISDSSITNSVDSSSFYMDVNCQKLPEKKTVQVAEVEDFKKINQSDTVELCDNIDFAGKEFEKIETFSGDFNGNGYTLSNLSEPLFNLFTGNMKNVSVSEFCITNYSRAGCLAKYCNEATFKDIEVTKSNSVSKENRITALAFEVRNSTIQDYSASLNFCADKIFGISYNLNDSLIQKCTIDLDVTLGLNGSALAFDVESDIYNVTTTGKVLITADGSRFYGVCLNQRNKAVNCSSDIDIYIRKPVSDTYEISGLFGNANQAKNCEFTGNIKIFAELTEESDFSCKVSGIAIECRGELVDCVNKGNITVKEKKEGLSIGGIAALNKGTIWKCINKGNITGGTVTGGIASVSEQGTIQKNRNLGNIKQAVTCGGIVGRIKQRKSEVKNCYNYAKIDSNDVLIGTVKEDSNTNIQNLLYIPIDDTQQSKYGKKVKEDPTTLNVILF